jgi:hypothetical protein
MTNDAKLGMVAGVAGVIVAAVLLSNNPPPAQSKSGEGPEPHAKDKLAVQHAQPGTSPAAVTPAGESTPETNTAALPSTPVIRTRTDTDAQPASRAGGMDEGP